MHALVLALVLAQYTPEEAHALFAEANEAYYQGDYALATAKYEKLLQAEYGGVEVLFNLGTSYLAKGALGPAVLYLEKARRLAQDEDIRANLALARQRQGDKVVGAAINQPFFERLADAMDERLVSTAFLSSCWLGFAAWLVLRRKTHGRFPWLLACVLLCSTSAVLGTGVLVHAYVRSHIAEAIVLSETAQVLEFPGETAKVAFEVHAGLKVRVMEASGLYVRIRLPNALEGWVERRGLAWL